jgi:O-antigen/teichoic acid export membrane protein
VTTGAAELEPAVVAVATDVRRNVGRDVVLTFGGRIGLTAAILLGDIILARTLGPDGKGAFALVLALSSLGSAILALGLEKSLGVFAARSLDIARRAFANAALWTVLVGILGALAILLLYGPPTDGGGATGPLAPIMPPLTAAQLLLVAFALPLELGYIIGLVGLLGRQRVVAFNVVRFMRRGLLTVFLIAVVLASRLDLTSLLMLNLAAMVATVGTIVWAMGRAGMLGLRISPPLLVKQLSFGVRTFVGTIAERLHFRIDAFLLTAFVSVGATGVYSVAQGLAETMWYLPSAVGLVLFSRAVQPGSDSAAIASAMTRSMLALIVVAAVPLWLVAPMLVTFVYGTPFREAGVAFQVILPGVVTYSIVAVLSQFLIAWGAPGRVTAVLILGLAVNVAANMVMIPAFGMVGAAASASASYSTTAVAMLLLYHRVSGRGLRETLLVRRSDVSRIWSEFRLGLGRLPFAEDRTR